MRKSNLEILQDQKRVKAEKTVVDEDDFPNILVGGPLNPTQRSFIEDPAEALIDPETGLPGDLSWEAAYMGPYGCAKTSTCLAKMILQALYEPGSQILIARNNFNDLRATTYADAEEMLQRLPPGTLVDRNKDSPMKWVIRPIGDPEKLSTLWFMGLTDGLGSYRFHSAFVDEADEVPYDRFNELRGRCRLKGCTNLIALAFNPPSEDHWLYTETTGLNAKGQLVKPPTLKLFRPQPKENARNLKTGYYEKLREQYPPDMVKRLVDGEWGSTFAGQPVYGEFSRHLHVGDLQYDRYLPLYRFWDFGYRFPICLWAQTTDDGGLRILREEMGKDVEIRPFAERCKAITAGEFRAPTLEVVDYGDPAARQKKDTGSTLAVLNQLGIQLKFRISTLDPGIRAIRHLLSRLIKKEPAFKIDKRCVVSIRALEGGYHYPDEETKSDALKPVKDNYYDHPMDALRYGVVNIYGAHGEDSVSPGASYAGRIPTSVRFRKNA